MPAHIKVCWKKRNLINEFSWFEDTLFLDCLFVSECWGRICACVSFVIADSLWMNLISARSRWQCRGFEICESVWRSASQRRLRHSHKKLQQHSRLSPASSRISSLSTITVAAHCLQAFIFIAAWTQSFFCDTRAVMLFCFSQFASGLQQFHHILLHLVENVPFPKKKKKKKRICKVISSAVWFLILNLKVSPSIAVTKATKCCLLILFVFPPCFL